MAPPRVQSLGVTEPPMRTEKMMDETSKNTKTDGESGPGSRQN